MTVAALVFAVLSLAMAALAWVNTRRARVKVEELETILDDVLTGLSDLNDTLEMYERGQ